MQLMIDIAIESAASLRLAAQLLLDHAAILDGQPNVPAGTIPAAPPAPPAPPAPSNVVPFPPPPPAVVPQAPATSIPNASTTAAHAPPMAPVAALPATSVPVPPAPAATAAAVPPAPITGGPVERDAAGMPWDARIHQKGKSKKKDHTWKLQKGIDPAIVAGVMQDLQARGLLAPTAPSGSTPAPAGAAAPVSLPASGAGIHAPGAYATSIAPPPPYPPGVANAHETGNAIREAAQAQSNYQAGQLPAPPPPPVNLQPAAAVPVPPGAAVGMPNAADTGMVQEVDPFRALVAKFTNARAKGILTADQVNNLITQAGAPSLQALKAMAHLVPVADALLDAALVMA